MGNLVESRMRGNAHVRFGGRPGGNGVGEIRLPRPRPTLHLPVSRSGATLFFQLISRRYEKASTVLTSNKSFEEWGTILGDEVMAAALIDRLLHHCHLVNIRGNSYRMREHVDAFAGFEASEN